MSAIGEPRPLVGNGFTLIEMLVTLAIAALIAGVAFPSLESALGYWASRSALGSVRGALDGARARALGTGTPVRFALTDSGRGFVVGNAAPVPLPPGTLLSGTPGVIDYYDDGSASGGQIIIQSGSVRTLLSVSPALGLTSVSQ